MTGLDLLREEMEKRGLNKSQIESKTAAVVLDICANSGDKFTKLQQEEESISKRIKELDSTARYLKNDIVHYERLISKYENTVARYKQEIKESEAYVDVFNEQLTKCETAEGRDTMRRAQIFINSVDVDTKYDNTAYIIALGAILSNGKIGAIQELKKINKKIPEIDGWCEL